MNLLVVGSGAREHALAWKLRQSPRTGRLFVAPGNAGTASLATNMAAAATDIEGLAAVAEREDIGLTLVGPEVPLAGGIVDRFRQRGLRVFGPSQAAAQIESSKVFAQQLMQRWGIPCAQGISFDSYGEARRFLEGHEPPFVIKADGLAAGKGVAVALSRKEADQALYERLAERVFGPAGERVVVQEHLSGREVSVFAFTDGQSLSSLVAACDYKRAYDADRGPNTGGMGSYSPPEFWTSSLADEIRDRIMRPTIEALAREGVPFQGILYAGLFLTSEGPKVIEFNCRLGDPEAQVTLPRLKTDLLEVVEAVMEGTLSSLSIQWDERVCVGVVLASQGYPDSYETGFPIEGLDQVPEGVLVFQAGTKSIPREEAGEAAVVTNGGRVLTVVGAGQTLAQAREEAYAAVHIPRFQGVSFRRDIAQVESMVRGSLGLR